jgi:hypothetical protein
VQEYAITSDDALVLDDLPEAPIVIVGAGYISVEFAGIFNGMGAAVHLIYRKDLPLTGCVLHTPSLSPPPPPNTLSPYRHCPHLQSKLFYCRRVSSGYSALCTVEFR